MVLAGCASERTVAPADAEENLRLTRAPVKSPGTKPASGPTRTLVNPMPGMAGLGATVVVPVGSAGYTVPRITSSSDRGVASDIGAFRVPCELSHFSFDDPIVFPGRPGAAHLHMYFGNKGTDAASTAASLAGGGASTCAGGTANRSAYWVPAMVDGRGGVRAPAGALFYYKTGYGGVTPAQVRQLPAGLRMIAGSAASLGAQEMAGWGCRERYIGWKASIQQVTASGQCRSGESLVLDLEFPQCWDGVNLDSSDHQRHMAYAVGAGCPASHPVALPVITFTIWWTIPAEGLAGWHLSSDMYDYASRGGGLSLHGDWFNGWDPAVAATWTRACLNASRDCHAYLLGDGRTLF